MTLTKEDLQAIAEFTKDIVKEELKPINARLDAMQSDMEQIKEDTAITRAAVNGLGEWTEAVSDVLKVRYPLQRAE